MASYVAARTSFHGFKSCLNHLKENSPLSKYLQKSGFFTSRRCYAAAAKKVYSRDKPHVNIGTIGHVDHGKTTLTAAITKYLSEQTGSKYSRYEDIDNAPEEVKRGITINAAYIEYETDKRHYSHVDCPGHADFIKNMITGSSVMDGGVLVVAATDGTMPQTKEHIILVKQIGVKDLVVYINKADAVDQEMLELVEMEIRDVLTEFGFDGDSVHVVSGSALCALEDRNPEIGRDSIKKLVEIIDETIPVPERDLESPPYLPIEHVYSVPGRGTVVSGKLLQGVLKKGDALEIGGFGKIIKSTATGIETFHKTCETGEAGDQLGVLLRGVKRPELRRGMVLGKAGTVKMHQKFEASVYVLGKAEGGIGKPISNNYTAMLYSKTWNMMARVPPSEENEVMVMPEEQGTVPLVLRVPLVVAEGDRFTIRSGKSTIGTGLISKLLEPSKEDIELWKQ